MRHTLFGMMIAVMLGIALLACSFVNPFTSSGQGVLIPTPSHNGGNPTPVTYKAYTVTITQTGKRCYIDVSITSASDPTKTLTYNTQPGISITLNGDRQQNGYGLTSITWNSQRCHILPVHTDTLSNGDGSSPSSITLDAPSRPGDTKSYDICVNNSKFVFC